APAVPGDVLGAEGPLAAASAVPHASGWPGPSGCYRVPLPAAVPPGGSADFALAGWSDPVGALLPDTGFTVWRALDGLPPGSLVFTEVLADPTPVAPPTGPQKMNPWLRQALIDGVSAKEEFGPGEPPGFG
ncbi:MAG: hypothetical protein ACKOQ5_03265, partial [Solirubrobacterales bacterium]